MNYTGAQTGQDAWLQLMNMRVVAPAPWEHPDIRVEICFGLQSNE